MKHEVKEHGVTMYANSKHKAVRLRHPSKRNCIWTFTQPAVRYSPPHMCHMCQQIHIFKTFHLHLNENGEVAVHPDIYELMKANGIVGELHAMKEVMPRPHALHTTTLNYTGNPMRGKLNGAPSFGEVGDKTYVPPAAWQPPAVFSREHGLVKAPGLVRRNLILPPKETHRLEPDGTWTYLPKEKK
jgi:hypothetical protein